MWRTLGACAAGAVAMICAPAWPADWSAAEVDRRCQAMGTWLGVTVTAPDRGAALAASEAALRAVERTEARLSTWRTDSELSRFNRSSPGVWHELSPALARDLAEAAGWWRQTNGYFSPGMAALVRAWDLRGSGRVPSGEQLTTAVYASRMASLELRSSEARRLVADFGVEEGGFGKGIALRDAARAAIGAGAECVRLDLGGQHHVEGDCGVAEFAIAHPRDRDRVIGKLELAVGSVATSGNSERAVTAERARIGHILDPRSGQPTPDYGSVTVVAPDPIAADCLSTALYVMGPEAAAVWLQGRPGIGVVFAVEGGGRLRLLSGGDAPGSITTILEGVELETLTAKGPDRGPPGVADDDDRMTRLARRRTAFP
jgi:thiamine biosynthesis lipoprotein